MGNVSFKISGKAYHSLKEHLFPGDGKEAVALAICGRGEADSGDVILLVHNVVMIPYEQCEIREHNFIKWSTELLTPHLVQAVKNNMAIVKIHSHPTSYNEFSQTDDRSDIELFDSIYGWMDNEKLHGSIVMLPDGSMFGRIVKPDLSFEPLKRISVVGDEILFWDQDRKDVKERMFSKRTQQTFGLHTSNLLGRLKIGVIGCSGTGSPTIEQLSRLGVGSLVLVDPDRVEEKNLNRILNASMHDAKKNKYKVEVLKKAIQEIGLGTEVITFNRNLYDGVQIVNYLAQCDVLFGCVDSVDGRHLLNQIASFYLIPYFDIGVKIIADGDGGIDQICGTVHYIQPGGSSLMTRGLYTGEDLRAAGLFRTNKKEYEDQKKSGYIVNITVDSPAVISINMLISSIGVNEFLARLHPFRYDPNGNFAITRISITDGYTQYDSDGESDKYLQRFVGRGDMKPMLNMPELK
ncbi:MAG: ThiF family adenylyltransferase [Bacteroidetes bacterium]|nr:ThiF family adenylyltransferase [Bacteroidota bacterium]